MVNYSLDDFENWATQNNIPTQPLNWKLTVQWYRAKPVNDFEKVVKQALTNPSSVERNFANIAKEWQREREREQNERNNMVDAQTWLNERFPTQESREKVKQLSLRNREERYRTNQFREHSQYPRYPRLREYSQPRDQTFGSLDLEGELDFNGFIGLNVLVIEGQNNLTKLKGLESCLTLHTLVVKDCSRLKSAVSFLDSWKAEITQLKAQLAEYENQETSSQTSQESSYSNLTTKIAQKKQELANLRDTTRKPTKFLRKEIELLEKLQQLAHKVSELEEKEANYRQQISQKEQTISQKQGQIEQLKAQEQQSQTKIKRLEKQITDLTAEKQAIQERMLQERQTALNDWNQEKTGLTSQITQLKEQKDTFQKSADYLRETLRGTEKSLEDIKRELAESQTQNQTNEQTYQQSLEQKEEVLRQRNEAFRVLQERNVGLQANLTKASEEISQLSQWISQLESASVAGDAFVNLKGELAKSQQAVIDLQEQLSAKQPKNYWWVYLLLAAGAVYLVMS